MNYPLEAVSLLQAEHLVFELQELILDPKFETTSHMDKIRVLMDEFWKFGVSAQTTAVDWGRAQGTNILQYVRINMHTISCEVDDLLGDWYALWVVTGEDKILAWNGLRVHQGCQ